MKSLPVLALTTLFLAACGGGGGDGGDGGSSNPPPPPPPPAATAQQIYDADRSELAARRNLTTGDVTINLIDFVRGASGYRIEGQASGGAWTTVATLSTNGNGGGQNLSWSGAAGNNVKFRAVALFSGYTVPIRTISRALELDTTPPATTPTIALDLPEPLGNSATASIANGATYPSVLWYVDDPSETPEQAIYYEARVYSSPYMVKVQPRSQPAPFKIRALLETGGDVSYWVERTVQSAVPAADILMYVWQGRDLSRIFVETTSGFGIVDVTLLIGNQVVGTKTPPAPGGEYIFDGTVLNLPSGVRILTAEVRTGDGTTTRASMPFAIDNPPVVNLTSPADGALVNGTLTIAGTATSDKAGVTFSVSGRLGGVAIPTATGSPFSVNMDVSALPAGSHALDLEVRDSEGTTKYISRTVTVTSTAGLAYTPALALGPGGTVLTTSGGANVLYQDTANGVRLRVGSDDIDLDTTGITNLGQWRVDGDQTFAVGVTTPNVARLFHWDENGVRQELGVIGATLGQNGTLLAAHSPWVLGSRSESGVPTLMLFNTQAPGVITPALGTVFHGVADLAIESGNPVIYFSGEDTSVVGIRRYEHATTNVTTVDAQAGLVQTYPRVEGTLLARRVRAAGTVPPFTLLARDLGGVTDETLSTTTDRFFVGPETVAWLEGINANTAIKIYDGTNVSTLSPRVDVELLGAGDGYALFLEDGKLYAGATDGDRTLLFDDEPDQATISGKTVYFRSGTSLYAVTLD